MISYWLNFKYISLDGKIRRKVLYEYDVTILISLSFESLYGISGR